MATQTRTGIGQVAVMMIPVSDHDRALELYVETLGLETRADISLGEQTRWIEVASAGSETGLALVGACEGGGESPGVDTRVALATDDADAIHADLLARGVDVDAEVMRMGGPVPPMFRLRDPDGNRVSIGETGR